MALYNKMRPKTLNQVKGQDKLIKILKDNLANGNLPNAMLFVGTRGTGKTSVARIVARMRNCEHPLEDGSCCNECTSCRNILAGSSIDVLELDAASNNGVDDVRALLENINYKPLGKEKVVILDEVHMLSTGAFNALLKALEEPPKRVLFILCTTELHKIPATIRSRCRKFQFESISDEVIAEKLKNATELYGKEVEEGALLLVAKAAKGSLRDAESIYEAFLDTDGVITADLVRETLGFSSEESIFAILDAIKEGNPILANAAVDEILSKGSSLSLLMEDCLATLMDVISVNLGGDILYVKEEYRDKITDYAFSFTTQRLFEIADAFKKTYEKRVSNMSFALQSMLIGLSCSQSVITQLEERVSLLESAVAAISSGAVVVTSGMEVDEQAVAESAEVDGAESASVEEVPVDSVPAEDISVESVPVENLPAEENPTAPAITADALAELKALGFAVVDNLNDIPFKEESLDASMLQEGVSGASALCDETPKESVPADVPTEEPPKEETVDTSTKTDGSWGASIFDDFARHFAGL